MPKQQLVVTSPEFMDHGKLHISNTGWGGDNSPALRIKALTTETVSLAIAMVDLDVPFYEAYPHWLVWNILPTLEIPGRIKKQGLPQLGNIVQGIKFSHQYRGPKIPFFLTAEHRYVITIYALDTELDISKDSDYKEFIQAVTPHLLGKGSIEGRFSRKDKKQ